MVPLLSLADEIQVKKETISFWSDGSRLQGDVFKPINLNPEDKLPGILLITGWGGNRANLNKSFAPQFAASGFVVMTFDFRGWGDSEGFFLSNKSIPLSAEDEEILIAGKQIRSIINPDKMILDARAALSRLVGESNVQPNNIGVWGTSFGGSIALVISAQDKRVKALISQMGTVNNKANFKMIPDSLVPIWESQRSKGEISSYPGPESSLPGLTGYPDLIAIKKYDPASYWHLIKIPTLIIDAKDEELFDRSLNGEKFYNFLEGRVTTEYIPIPGTHYDMYKGNGYELALASAQKWFLNHLKMPNN